MTHNPIQFGHAGVDHQWADNVEGIAIQDRGIVRTVSADVAYAPPPLPHVWQRTASNQRYFFPLDSDSSEIQTLKDFAEKIRHKRTPEELSRLDAIVQQLLRSVAVLHEARTGVGLLSPENIVIVGNPPTVLLVDVGFTHDGAFPPKWIRDPCYPELWDTPAVQQQHRGVTNSNFHPRQDLQTLGRLLQGVLIGKWQKAIVTSLEIKQHYPTKSKRLWRVLDDCTTRQNISSAAQLAAELSRFPLSSHWISNLSDDISTPSRKPNPLLRGLFAITILAAVTYLGAAYYYDFPPFEPVEKATPSIVPANTVIKDLLDPIAPNATSSQVAEALAKAEAIPPAQSAAQKQSDQSLIDGARSKFFAAWEKEFREARPIIDDPNRQTAFDRLKLFSEQFKKVQSFTRKQGSRATIERERRCIDSLQVYATDQRFSEGFRASLPSSVSSKE